MNSHTKETEGNSPYTKLLGWMFSVGSIIGFMVLLYYVQDIELGLFSGFILIINLAAIPFGFAILISRNLRIKLERILR